MVKPSPVDKVIFSTEQKQSSNLKMVVYHIFTSDLLV